MDLKQHYNHQNPNKKSRSKNIKAPCLHNMAWNFKRQPHKMVKHTQTICRQQSTNCLSVLDHFVGLALEGLNKLAQLENSEFSLYGQEL